MPAHIYLSLFTALCNANAACAAFYVDDEAPVAIPPLTTAASARVPTSHSQADTMTSPDIASDSAIAVHNPPMSTWMLVAGRSLHDNLDTWVRRAGYEKLAWNTSYTRRITDTTVYTGSFLEALQRIAERTPELDFLVSKNHRTLRVVDAGFDAGGAGSIAKQ